MKSVYNRFNDPSSKICTVMNIVDNTVYIYDYISKPYWNEVTPDPESVTSEEFLDTVRGMTGDLTVRINSKGGELGYSLSVYNTLLEHDGKVTTIVDGYAYSCAAWVLLAGDDRQITVGGIVMIHNPIIYTEINSEESVNKVVSQWKASRDSIANIIVDRTGGKTKDVYSMMDDQTFMNADMAIKKGFCTGKREGKAFIPTGVRNYLPTVISDVIEDQVPETLNIDYNELLTKSTLFRSKKLTNR